jgi:hypothetical protein
VKLELPAGLVTADGQQRELAWQQVEITPDAPFVQAIPLVLAPSTADGTEVVVLTANASVAGEVAARGELVMGVAMEEADTSTVAGETGALVESTDSAIVVLAPAGTLPEGTVLELTELAATTPLTNTADATIEAAAVVTASATRLPQGSAWAFLPFLEGRF